MEFTVASSDLTIDNYSFHSRQKGELIALSWRQCKTYFLCQEVVTLKLKFPPLLLHDLQSLTAAVLIVTFGNYRPYS